MKEEWEKLYNSQLTCNLLAEKICQIDSNRNIKISFIRRIFNKILYIKWRITDFISYIKDYNNY